jgi:hypothetical protein
MATFIISSSENSFAVNGNKYFRVPVKIYPNGDRVMIVGDDPIPIANGHFSEFRNGNDENAPFDSVGELIDFLDTVFSVGGGGGNGATNFVMTQAEYDAITPNPDHTYDIIEE